METYCRGSKKRSLRTRSVETREAVKLATQPDSNSTRTLAMSTLGERIGKPTARTSRTHRRSAKGEHNIQVVNHQVKHHVHVQRAGREDGEPVSLKEHGPAQ